MGTDMTTTDEPAYAKRGTKRRMTAEEPAADDAHAALPAGFTAIGDEPSPAAGLSAPWDGKPVTLIDGDGHSDTGHWRWTRSFTGGVWRERGLWAKHNAAGAPLGFQPVAWRRANG